MMKTMLKVNRSVITTSVKNGRSEFVERGIDCVWDLTIASWTLMTGEKHAQFRLQRHVIVAGKARR